MIKKVDFKVGDLVYSTREVLVKGVIVDIKPVSNVLFSYILYRIEDENTVQHWINGMYLKKLERVED